MRPLGQHGAVPLARDEEPARLEALLAGTITAPRLAMPDLGKLLLQGALEGLKSGELPKLVEELFKKKKKG